MGYLISYPKCGRTWVRVMMKKLCQTTKMSNPMTYRHWVPKKEGGFWWQQSPVVLLIRDPRDVIVSYYFQCTKRTAYMKKGSNISMSISEFIRDSKWGIGQVIHFYNVWANIWESIPQCLLLRYEDLHKNCKIEFQRLLRFFSIEIDEAVIDEVVNYGSFGNMQLLERQKKRFGVLGTKTRSDPESYKVRRGKVGGYIDYLTTADMQYIEDEIQNKLGDHIIGQIYRGYDDAKSR